METKGKAIVAYDALHNGPWKMEKVTVRPPGPGEVLVEIVAAGICHSDVFVGSLPKEASPLAVYPRVLGHEGSGYVRQVGSGVTGVEPGDPVLCSFDYCRECNMCKSSIPALCAEFSLRNTLGTKSCFKVEDGSEIAASFFGQSSFASHSIVQQSSLVNVKDILKTKEELELLSPLGCGAQTGAGTVTNVADAGPKDIICVLGLGGVGLAAIMAAKIRGCQQIIGIDRAQSRIDLAKGLGATHVLNTSDISPSNTEPLHAQILSLTSGLGPTITIDTTGVPFILEAGIAFTRPRGKYIQVGVFTEMGYEIKLGLMNIMDAKWITGAIEGWADPKTYLPQLVKWWREGKFPMEKLVGRYKAEEYERALKEMEAGGVVKPVLCWT